MTTTKPEMISNILAVYREASDGQIADGIAWYADAHTAALALARQHDGDVDRAAGVLAALSPQMPWNRNVALATRLYVESMLSGGGLPNSINNANKIYNGADWREVFGENANKIRNFAANIADPTDRDAVTIDRHAADIARGEVSGKESKSLTPKQYRDLADCYRDAARTIGVSPAQVQAVTWVVWRESRIRCAAANRREAGR